MSCCGRRRVGLLAAADGMPGFTCVVIALVLPFVCLVGLRSSCELLLRALARASSGSSCSEWLSLSLACSSMGSTDERRPTLLGK